MTEAYKLPPLPKAGYCLYLRYCTPYRAVGSVAPLDACWTDEGQVEPVQRAVEAIRALGVRYLGPGGIVEIWPQPLNLKDIITFVISHVKTRGCTWEFVANQFWLHPTELVNVITTRSHIKLIAFRWKPPVVPPNPQAAREVFHRIQRSVAAIGPILTPIAIAVRGGKVILVLRAHIEPPQDLEEKLTDCLETEVIRTWSDEIFLPAEPTFGHFTVWLEEFPKVWPEAYGKANEEGGEEE